MKRFVLLALVLTLVLVMSGCFLFNRKPVVESIEISGTGNAVTLTLTLSDPDNDPLTVEIDWGDGSEKFSEENITTGTVDASHTYDSTGTYEVVITVSDGKAVVTLPTLKLNIPFQSESVILNF
ncbi:MAG: hypothetical protein B5M49_00695 [Thermotoga sp. 4484_232]|nr:MAG: hypothetical protein B5M49_00695 [Thermotoga sp. 4484_232]